VSHFRSILIKRPSAAIVHTADPVLSGEFVHSSRMRHGSLIKPDRILQEAWDHSGPAGVLCFLMLVKTLELLERLVSSRTLRDFGKMG
jgi:hypothetical protein